jgi:hypothetical protein
VAWHYRTQSNQCTTQLKTEWFDCLALQRTQKRSLCQSLCQAVLLCLILTATARSSNIWRANDVHAFCGSAPCAVGAGPPTLPAKFLPSESSPAVNLLSLLSPVLTMVRCQCPSTLQCEEALNWAMHVPSLSLAQRCMHVARALSPALTPVVVDTLLSAMLQCYSHPSATAFDFLAEILVTLRELLEANQPQQVRCNCFPPFLVRDGCRSIQACLALVL